MKHCVKALRCRVALRFVSVWPGKQGRLFGGCTLFNAPLSALLLLRLSSLCEPVCVAVMGAVGVEELGPHFKVSHDVHAVFDAKYRQRFEATQVAGDDIS